MISDLKPTLELGRSFFNAINKPQLVRQRTEVEHASASSSVAYDPQCASLCCTLLCHDVTDCELCVGWKYLFIIFNMTMTEFFVNFNDDIYLFVNFITLKIIVIK